MGAVWGTLFGVGPCSRGLSILNVPPLQPTRLVGGVGGYNHRDTVNCPSDSTS